MDYLNYFGTSTEQVKDIEELENELLMRKVISLGLFAEILRKEKIFLYLSVENTYKKLRLKIYKENYQEVEGLDTLSYILAAHTSWGLNDYFFDEHITLIKCAMLIDEQIENEDIGELKIASKLMIDGTSNEWLRIIFKVLKKEFLYTLLMNQILNSELKVNDVKTELVKI
jgi:hypothetical protein